MPPIPRTESFRALAVGIAVAALTTACSGRSPAAVAKPMAFWPPPLFADDGHAQFELVADDRGTLPAQDDLEIFEAKGGRWLARWGDFLYPWTDGPMPMPMQPWQRAPIAPAPGPCGPQPDAAQGIVTTVPVITESGACAYTLVVPETAPPYVVDRGAVRMLEGPAQVFPEPPQSATQVGGSLVVSTRGHIVVFSASTLRYLGTIRIEHLAVFPGPGHLVVQLRDRVLRLRPTGPREGDVAPFPEIESMMLSNPEKIASPRSLTDGRLDTHALIEPPGLSLTIHLRYPAVAPRVCIVEGDSGATGGRLLARGYADLERDRAVDVEGVAPDEPAAERRAPDRSTVVMVQVITVDLQCVCSSATISPPCDGLCQVAEVDVGCRRRSP